MTAGDDLFAGHRPQAVDSPDDDAGTTDAQLEPPVDGGDDVSTNGQAAAGGAPNGQSVPEDEPAPEPAPESVPEPNPTQQVDPVPGPDVDAGEPVAVDRQGLGEQGASAATDPDQTVVMPLAVPPSGTANIDQATADGTTRSRGDGESWDTGTIRRWDPTQTDDQMATSTGPLRRPAELDDREEVTVDREDGRSRWYEVPVMIITALTLAFLLRTFVVQVFYIPSGSMIPTLEINDRIAVEKISYLTREPSRGEVVVFAGDDPLAATSELSTADRVLTGVGQFLGVIPVDAKDFVKRVIGLPGDQVSIVDGSVSVNGVELDEPYARLDNDNGEWEVPAGMLFVMGDNRANSGDSRSALGYIPEEDIVGRAVTVIWPFEHAGSIPGEAHDAAVDAGS